MFLRLQPFVYGGALTLAALGCSKSSESIPSKDPDSYAASQEPSRARQADNTEKKTEHVDKAEKAEKLDDAGIAAITAAANSAEIEQGRLARDKATDPRVRDFAAMMVDHHGEAQQDQQKLSVEPNPNVDSRQLQGDAESALDLLKQKRGKDFDQAYLQLQIDEHRKLLDTLKERLLPSVKDSKLEAYLQNIKPKVESHLALAERLRAELNGTSSLNEKLDDSGHPTLSNTRGSNPRLSDRSDR